MSQFKKDLIASFVFLIFGAFVLISVPLTIDDPGVSVMGPRVFPYFIGTCMVLLSLALLAITLVKHRKAAGSDTKTTYTTDEERKTALRDELRAIALAAIILVYAIVFEFLGYFPSTLLAATAILLLFRVKKIWAYPIVYLRVLYDQAGYAHDSHGHRPGAGQAVRVQPAPRPHRVQGQLGHLLHLSHQLLLHSAVCVYAAFPLR